MATLIITIASLTLLVVNPFSITAPTVRLIRTARSYYVVLLIMQFCALVYIRVLRYGVAWVDALVGSGLFYGEAIGIAVKRSLGYTPDMVVPLAAACVVFFTCPYMVQSVVRNSAHLTKKRSPAHK